MKFLTQKFAWMIENPTGPLAIPEGLLPMDSADSGFCNLTKYCHDDKNDEFCGSPLGDEMREQYCIRYREIKKAMVQGVEELSHMWNPEQTEQVSLGIINLKDRSQLNKILKEKSYTFVKSGGVGLR